MPDTSQRPQPGQLHHVELYCSDLDASLSFWEWLLSGLGYSLYQNWDGGRSYRLGGTYIVFVQADDELTEAIRERDDTTLLYEDDHPYAGGEDHYALYCEDPERVKVEIVAPS